MASASVDSVTGPNSNLVSLNLFEIQGSLSRKTTPSTDKAAALMKSIRRSRDSHGLYALDVGNHGAYERFVRGNLSDAEVDHIRLAIENERLLFGRFAFLRLLNYAKFMTKKSTACYCDPFSPEPRVYKGHVIFHSKDVNDLMSQERYDHLPEEERSKRFGDRGYSVKEYNELALNDSEAQTFEFGKLRFEVFEGTKVRVKMYKRYTRKVLSAERTFSLHNDVVVMRFKTLISHLISTASIVVDINEQQYGRVWHSYDLEGLFEALNSDLRMYYQDNKVEKVIVA